MLRPALFWSMAALGCVLALLQTASAVPINLTRESGVVATASSVRDPVVDGPENVIDGNRSSRIGTSATTEYIWHSTPTSAAAPLGYNTQFQSLWLEVDLGADFYLDRVQLFSRLSSSSFTTRYYAAAQQLLQNFHIDVYNAAGNTVFSKNYLAGKSTDDEPWGADDMRNIVGRKVRITRDPRHNIVGSLANSAMAMAEFEVWGQPTPILQNLAKNGTVTATAANTLGSVTTPASAGIDGNISGHFWHGGIYESSTAGGAPFNGPFGNGHYWQVELPQLSTINYVTIFARTDGEPSSFQAAAAWSAGVTDFRNGPIRLSILGADGSTVVTTADTTLGGDDFQMQRYDLTTLFESNPLGKFVRIESLDNTKTLTFGEVEVFGTPSGGSGLAIPEPVLAGPLAALAVAAITLRRRRKSAASIAPHACGFAALLAAIVFSSSADAVPTNLSVAGTTTATASSQLNANNTPAKARDGNRSGVGDANSFWHTVNSPVPDVYGMQHWYEINLGSDMYLDRLEIFPRPGSSQYQDTVKNFKLEVYNAAGTTVFSQMFLPDTTTGDRSWGTNAFRNILGARVRIIRDPPHAQWDRAMAFGEFEIWGQSSPITTNLALNRPTTSSTPLPVPVGGGPTGAELGNDGNIAGHFWLESVFLGDNSSGAPFTGPYGNGQFWQTQLAQPSAISYVNLFARSDDFTQNGPVRVSIVGADGTTIVASADVDLSVLDWNLSRYDFTQVFAGNPVGSYVRVEALDTTKVLTLAEVEVFGPPAVVVGVPGDYNSNGIVDGADYVVWRKHNGQTGGATAAQGDGTGDGNVNAADYSYWRTRFGNTSGSGSSLGGSAVPEPASVVLLLMGSAFCLSKRARRATA